MELRIPKVYLAKIFNSARAVTVVFGPGGLEAEETRILSKIIGELGSSVWNKRAIGCNE